jgi:hypothetical protein
MPGGAGCATPRRSVRSRDRARGDRGANSRVARSGAASISTRRCGDRSRCRGSTFPAHLVIGGQRVAHRLTGGIPDPHRGATTGDDHVPVTDPARRHRVHIAGVAGLGCQHQHLRHPQHLCNSGLGSHTIRPLAVSTPPWQRSSRRSVRPAEQARTRTTEPRTTVAASHPDAFNCRCDRSTATAKLSNRAKCRQHMASIRG